MNGNDNNNNSNLSEVYSAIQGEGPLLGIRQIFVRFSGCDLRCIWCDTPLSLNKTKACNVEISPGERKFKQYNNPVSVDELIKLCVPLIPSMHHSLSVTGGEPLLQSRFLESFLPELKKTFNTPIYLETGGHRPNELIKVIKHVDYISMDFKLQSSAFCGDLWNKHFEFLKISVQSNARTWVKIVITDKTNLNELEYALNNIKSIVGNKNNVEIILQPVTPINDVMPVSEMVILEWQKSLIKIFPEVRVIPQTHKLIGQK